MQTDHIISNIQIDIAKELDISVADVDKVLDKYYKAVAKAKREGSVKVKMDFFGSFNIKLRKDNRIGTKYDPGLNNT